MDLFVNSDFNTSGGTLLQAYGPDLVGASWLKFSGNDATISSAHRVYGGAAGSVYYANQTTKSGYYWLEFDLTFVTSGQDATVYWMWNTVTGERYGFGAHYPGQYVWQFQVSYIDPGTGLLNTGFSQYFASISPGDTHHVRIEGYAGLQNIYIDNALLVSSNNDQVIGFGNVGIGLTSGSPTSGVHISNFKAYMQEDGDPFTLTGTQISAAPYPMDRLMLRTHRRSSNSLTLPELWFFRNNAWNLFPVQPLASAQYPITLTQKYKEPSSLEFYFADTIDAALSPSNMNSNYNSNGGAYDPLIDSARQVLLRLGTLCYSNIALGRAVTGAGGGTFEGNAALTDGFLTLNGTTGLDVLALSNSTATLTCDLGSIQMVRHIATVFACTSTMSPPMTAQVGVSEDNIHYNYWPARPLGGPLGDFPDSDPIGRTIDFIQPDIDMEGRYVQLIITATDTRNVAIGEMAVYGGATAAYYGANVFVGYLGDDHNVTPEGLLRVVATDTQKRLSDSNDAHLTYVYSNEELADISYDLLTNTGYWPESVGNYSAPFQPADICWLSGISLTGLVFPTWQGANGSQLSYQQQLWQAVGWHLFTTGNGRLAVFLPPVAQFWPDRICTAGPDGLNDAVNNVRNYADKDLRNVCHVITGIVLLNGSGDFDRADWNSKQRYGRRTMWITDVLANTPDIRTAIATQVIREYAWRVQTLTNVILPDYETRVKQMFAFRASLRPQLWAKTSQVLGNLRMQELWSLEEIDHTITTSKWSGACTWNQYFPQLNIAPSIQSIASGTGLSTATVTWNGYSANYATGMQVYYSQINADGPFTAGPILAPGATSYTITGLTINVPVWAYVVAIDVRGYVGAASTVLMTTVGLPAGGAANINGWQIGTLTASYPAGAPTGPDANGVYTYEFALQWTVPASGMTQFSLYYAVGSVPTSASGWKLVDAWHGRLIAASHNFQGAVGACTWYGRFRTSPAITHGTTVYWKLVTYTDENSAQSPQDSNVASVLA